MARSKRDNLKRSCAQAINHMAAAVLDINDVYNEFKEQHPEQAEILKIIMLGIAKARELLLDFVKDAWQLDEDQIKVYM